VSKELAISRDLLIEIKARVRRAQQRAALSANAEMIRMYWDIGCLIAARQKEEGWGTGVIPRLAAALKNELPEEKGFSERNLKYMIRFAREYSLDQIAPQRVAPIGQQAAALLQNREETIVQQAAAQLSWYHHIALLDKLCGGQEHDWVRVGERIIKVTRHGVFGLSPGIELALEMKRLSSFVKNFTNLPSQLSRFVITSLNRTCQGYGRNSTLKPAGLFL